MQSITVKLRERSYRIKIAAGLLDQRARSLAGPQAKSLARVIVSNPTVDALYGSRLARSLKAR